MGNFLSSLLGGPIGGLISGGPGQAAVTTFGGPIGVGVSSLINEGSKPAPAASSDGTPAGMPPLPNIPNFTSDLDSSGNLMPQYSVTPTSYMSEENQQLGHIPSLNTQPMSELYNYANAAPGSSPWAQAQLTNLRQQGNVATGNAGAQAASAVANADDALASRGGLSTGAAENIARGGANNLVNARQGVQNQVLQGGQNILSQDAQNQLGVLENLPGQEVQSLQPALQEQSLWQQAAGQNAALNEQANISNQQAALSGLNSQNQYAMQTYQNQIAQQAANQEAQAYQKAPKK